VNSEKKSFLSEFSRRAMQRLQDKKVPKHQTLHIPSLDINMKFRSLTYSEIMECMSIEDDDDKRRSDKYCIYLASEEPSLKDAATEVMKEEASLPPDQRTVLESLDIVNIFDVSEITEIATEVMKLSGVIGEKSVTVVKQLKN